MNHRRKRLARLLEVLRLYGADPDVETVACALGCSPQTIRRDVRDLREAGVALPAPRENLARGAE